MGQAHIPPTPTSTTLQGRTALITGANTGLGFETARQLLLLGLPQLIITTRDSTKSAATIEALRNNAEVKNKNPGAVIHPFEAEMDDLESVVRICERVKMEIGKLDVLILNAGVVQMKSVVSEKTGNELTMQINAYSTLLVALQLLPLLKSTATSTGIPSRLTFLGSGLHTAHSLGKQPLSQSTTTTSIVEHFNQTHASGPQRYNDSKFLVAAFAQHLATIVPASQVIINHVCPGVVTTDLARSFPGVFKWTFLPIWRRWKGSRDVGEGARCVVAAVAVVGKEGHGRFIQGVAVADGAELLAAEEGKQFSGRLYEEMLAEEKRAVGKYGLATA